MSILERSQRIQSDSTTSILQLFRDARDVVEMSTSSRIKKAALEAAAYWLQLTVKNAE